MRAPWKDGFEREIAFSPAYDKRHPDPNKSYGIHGVDMRFFLIGPDGAVQFVVYTNWQLQRVQEELDAKRADSRFPHLTCHPMPVDLGYHSRVPRYEGQIPMGHKCDLIGGECYYDGSGLNAEPVYWKLVEEGEDAVWQYLREYYEEVFVTRATA